MNTILTTAIVLAAIEILLFWGKCVANKNTAAREGENYQVPLLSSGPWWVRWFHKFWFAFHFPAILVLAPVTISFAVIGRNGQLVVPTPVIHCLNLLLLVGGLVWEFL